jgi:hypothetical protein
MLKDYNDPINHGFLFCNLPALLMSASFDKNELTDSALLLKSARIYKNSTQTKADHRILRKVRDGKGSSELIFEFLSSYAPEDIHESLEDGRKRLEGLSPNEIGSWQSIKEFIQGYKRHRTSIKELDFIGYIESILHFERKLITSIKQQPECFRNRIYFDIAPDLLPMNEEYGFNDPENVDWARNYWCALLLFWTALFARYLQSSLPNNKASIFSSYLDCVIPKRIKKRTIFPNENLLEKIKHDYQCNHNAGKAISWESIYQILATVKYNGMSTQHDGIKKQFQRIRRGNQKLTCDDFFTLFAPLLPKRIGKPGIEAHVITIVQVADNVLRKLSKDGMTPEDMIAQMSRYPQFLEFVDEKYKLFQKTGIYSPLIEAKRPDH